MKSLYDINNEYLSILNYIENEDSTDSEYEDMLLSTWEKCEGDLQSKVDGYIYVLKEYRAQQEALAEEIKRLQARKKSAERNEARIRNILGQVLTNLGYDKLKTTKFTLSAFKDNKLDVYGKVPDDYKVEYVARKNDDKKIKEALENGEALNFARLTYNFTLR